MAHDRPPDAEYRASVEARVAALERTHQVLVAVVERQRADVVRLDRIVEEQEAQLRALRVSGRGGS